MMDNSELSLKWTVPLEEIELGKKLGEGAFGQVYEARWRDQKVAVKESLISDPESRKAFLGEAETMLALKPHVRGLHLFDLLWP